MVSQVNKNFTILGLGAFQIFADGNSTKSELETASSPPVEGRK